MKIEIRLDWPHKDLKPNARPHWSAASSAKRAAKEGAYWATKIAMGVAKIRPAMVEHDGETDLVLRQIAHPPDARDRDRDNLDASLKAARDGIALALGINDKFFLPAGIEWGALDRRAGHVIIEMEIPTKGEA